MAESLFRGMELWMYDLDVAPTFLNLKEARAEYVRLAKAANKRIQRIRESEYSASAAAQRQMFGSVKALKTERQVYAALQQVARFTSQKTSSISGIRKVEKKQLQTMREMGYTFLNKGNIADFGRFWQEVRKHSAEKNLKGKSDRIVELYRIARAKRIDPLELAKDFEYWIDHLEELSTLKRSNKIIGADEVRKKLDMM